MTSGEAIVILHRETDGRTLTSGVEYAGFTPGGTWTDVLFGEAFEAQGGSMCVSVPAWSSGVLVRGLGGTWREHPEGCAGERAAMGGVRPSTTAQSCTVAGPDLKRGEAARGVCASCLPAFPAFRLIHYR